MSKDIFDFGFSAVDEEQVSKPAVTTAEEKVNKLAAAIFSLLDGLAQNPEKSYIHWPDRANKIAAFRTKIQEILDG